MTRDHPAGRPTAVEPPVLETQDLTIRFGGHVAVDAETTPHQLPSRVEVEVEVLDADRKAATKETAGKRQRIFTN